MLSSWSKMLRKLTRYLMPFVSRLVYRRRLTLVFTSLFLSLLVYVRIHKLPDTSVHDTGYKTILDNRYTPRVNNYTKILLWTTVFGGKSWYDESIRWANVKGGCPDNCILTKDKTEIESADAVIFHLDDITVVGNIRARFSNVFPRFRHQDQVWILYNNEPITRIFGDMGAWQGVFNWTWTFKRSSEVYEPHGRAVLLNETEKAEVKQCNYYNDKRTHRAIAMISDCTDEARRYRLIGALSDYIDIKVFGDCGEKCPTGIPCDTLLNDYKFYLAFENSDCHDYVTEKYWRSLDKNMIPIVAWRTSMEGLVLPGTYINVFDFPNLDAAGRYIREVDRNETLYNSYFKWKFTHKIAYRNYFGTSHWCRICDLIQKRTVPRMVYHDMHGWLKNDTAECQPVTVCIRFEKCLSPLVCGGYSNVNGCPIHFHGEI